MRTYTSREIKQGTRSHAKSRAQSRYGLRLNASNYGQMVRAIEEKRTLAVLRISQNRMVCLIEWQGKELVAVYSRNRGEILTFLPPDCNERAALEAARKGDRVETSHIS